MRRILSLILITAILLTTTALPTFASDTVYRGLLPDGFHGQERFEEIYGPSGEYFYEELYYYKHPWYDYHDLDWVLVKASFSSKATHKTREVIGDRVFAGVEHGPFRHGYAIYEFQYGGHFSEIDSDSLMWYPELEEIIEETNIGRPIGDADFDNALTVMDATFLQQALAGLRDFHQDDDISEYSHYVNTPIIDYVSDINRDDHRDILDATFIQLKLAGLYQTYNEDRIVVEYEQEKYPDGPVAMPKGRFLEFTTLENGNDADLVFSNGKTTDNIDSDRYITIIKSPEQYYETFNLMPPLKIVEFMNLFDDNWMVIAVTRVNGRETIANIEEMCIKDGVLYVKVSDHTNSTDTDVSPLYLSMTSVDKDDVALVTEIFWTE